LGASKLTVAVGLKGTGEGVQVGSPGCGVLAMGLGIGVDAAVAVFPGVDFRGAQAARRLNENNIETSNILNAVPWGVWCESFSEDVVMFSRDNPALVYFQCRLM
jgi:hypothetical protein